jgi:hypothetical protein
MSQYTINIGALPNDGTGDPLRTAFNETNLNFNQIFAAGPVLSNVQIANNSILTTNTNGNLVLAPNGIGVVQSVSIVPNMSNIRNLGSSTQRWSSLYVQYLDLSGPLSVGDLTVAGNLTVTGNTIQIGNLVTDAKTIQLANTAASANAANGSGMTVGSNDNIATLLYSNTANAWTTNIGVSVLGNVTGNYFVGNGSQLTGVTASGVAASALTGNTLSSNVLLSSLTSLGTLANLSVSGNVTGGNVLTGGLVSATGNITGNYILGNISQASGFPATYGNANVATFLAAFGSNTVSTTGNITGNYFVGNGSLLTSLTGANVTGTVANATSATTAGTVTSNAQANITSVGTLTSLSSSGNVTSGNILTGGLISATGNITGNYIFGNGSQLTGINNSFAGEMHVSKDGNDSTGTGNILRPYLTVTHALTQVAGGRNTIVIHPGEYIENPTMTSTNTQLITYDATGASTIVVGTVTMANVNSRIAGLRMANLIIAGNSQAYISTSTVTEQFTKSSSGYVEVDDCELQVSGNVLISGSGSISIIGNKINNLVVNNAGAAVLVKGANDCVMPQVTAGSLNIVDSIIRASSNTANAVTASAGTVITLMNNQIVTPAADNVARVSIAGYHSIISVVYNKANSTLSNSLNSVVYFQTANVDSLVSSGNVTGNYILGNGSQLTGLPATYGNANVATFLAAFGSNTVSTTGNITAGNVSTGVITLTNGAVIKDTAGDAVAFGQSAGLTSQGTNAVAIGSSAGGTSQGDYAVAIGVGAGANSQGVNSVAIGRLAGNTNQANNSIIINATGAVLDQTVANTFTVSPVRNDVANVAQVMFYNTTSKEITYGNVISVAGNITGNYILGNGSQLTGIAASYGNSNVATFLAAYGSNTVSTTGNITSGNILTSGLISATGNITGGNLSIGTITTTGNITFAGDSSSAPSLNNFNVNAVSITATAGNLAVINGGAGGESGGFISATRGISATGNVTGGNVLTGGLISATSTITSAANITGGNVLTGGLISATGTITSAANITGGNILTGGLISATGNVSGGNLNVTGNIIDTGALSIITGSNGNIALAPNGTGIVTVSSALSVTGNVTGNTAGFAIGYLNIPQVSFAANATIAATDAGRHYYSTSASNLTLTIANNTSVSWAVGTAITVVNRGTGNITVARGTGVSLYLAGNSSTANRTVSTYGMATLINVEANVWMINGTGVS